ncbi:hypothetical protein JTB14_009959 [Gonioctena quinquepunctata]|nr:hypothetical protein JTB14_009959 [Gonioctena quinquepunctata]
MEKRTQLVLAHTEGITRRNYFSPTHRKIASEPPTPSHKGIEEEEVNTAVFPPVTKEGNKREEKEKREEEDNPTSTSNQVKPQLYKKKEQKPKLKKSSISSSGETPKKINHI